MTNPPTGEPEQRWQQPSFGPPPPDPRLPATRPTPFYPPAQRVPPASTVETVVSALARLVWPIAIVLFITTNLGFVPMLITAIVASVVLGAVRKNLRQRRYAALPPGPDGLR